MTQKQLFDSLEDFKARIIPIFEQVHAQRLEIQSLQARLETSTTAQTALHAQLSQIPLLQNEVRTLKSSFSSLLLMVPG